MTRETGAAAEGERVARTAVDIYSTPDGLVIVADLPGIPRDGLRLTLNGSELLLEGEAQEPAGEPVGGIRLPTRYRRLFTLARAVDREGIRARLDAGLLHITLPHPDWIKPRTIPVEKGE